MNELTIFNPVKAEMALAIPNLRAITKIVDEPGAMTASLGLKQVTAALSAVESIRKSTKQPFMDKGKMIDDYAKSLTADAVQVQAQLKKVLLEWNSAESARKEKERRALEEAKRIEDERRALELARDVSPPAADDFDALLKAPDEIQREVIIKEANAGVEQFVADKVHESQVKALDKKSVKGVRKVWRFEVVDQVQVPREFLMVNEMAVRKKITETEDPSILSIAGVRIYQEEILAAR